MLVVLIIVAVYIVAAAIIRWAETPTEKHTPLDYPTKPPKPIRDVFDLLFPDLDD